MILLILATTLSILIKKINLHFILILLILIKKWMSLKSLNLFTFHFDSINTRTQDRDKWKNSKFTFHFDSINTSLETAFIFAAISFTFHFDSINTWRK
ncbi:hypothetical protein HMPREF9129_2123 [Peptoniphilus indolicus ATCC 29427]|uniref:Uncharacterized protein n=1 Tax=Peptoniphilus indolicus ATCC 29427 TaxID=997350 RepID=G4D6U3_9FIRM|nr:hypothetical protein HMPREF9129_2123 [Peptoniphilus indolicus ATCC 29427]